MPFKIKAPLIAIAIMIATFAAVTLLRERPAQCPTGVVCIGAPLPAGGAQ